MEETPKSATIILKQVQPKEFPKDCKEFTPLRDGTLTGDWRYCALSLQCKQMHPSKGGILIGCISHFLYVTDPEDGSTIYAPFCTGCLPEVKRQISEIVEVDD